MSKRVDPLELIRKYYDPESEAYRILTIHGAGGGHVQDDHGALGADLLRKEGLPRHALVCERHTGTGVTLEEILREGYEMPHREMVPITLEEQIICFADCFYSKGNVEKLTVEKSVESLREKQRGYGQDNLDRFDAWCTLFL